MANTILARIFDLINTGQTLPQAIESVVPGADVTYWQKAIQRHNDSSAPKKAKSKSKSPRSNSRRCTMRTVIRFDLSFAEKQTAKTGKATTELVARVNGQEEPRFVNNVLEVF